MLKKLAILLALVGFAASMGRPMRRYRDCSCETPHYEDVPCDSSEEPTPPDEVETTSTAAATTKITTPSTTTKTTTVPTTTKTSTVPTTTRTSTVSTTITTSTIPSTTSIATSSYSSTTQDPRCPSILPMYVFRRTRGYWCMAQTVVANGTKDIPMPWRTGRNNCLLNNWVLSSFELDSEWKTFRDFAEQTGYITGAWLAMDYNNSTQQYEWTDGQALPELRFAQPEVIDPNGKVAWIIDFAATEAPYGKLAVVTQTGFQSPLINMGACGEPGAQFG